MDVDSDIITFVVGDDVFIACIGIHSPSTVEMDPEVT